MTETEYAQVTLDAVGEELADQEDAAARSSAETAGGQATLSAFADPVESGGDVATLAERVEQLESDHEAAVQLLEDVIDQVNQLATLKNETDSAASDQADDQQHQKPTHTTARGYY